MKTSFISGFILLLILSAFQMKGQVTITGEIQNHEDKQLKIRDFMGKSAWVEYIDIVDGKFSRTLPIKLPSIRTIIYGNNYTELFLHPDHPLKISFDASNFDGSLHYEGELAMENSLLDSLSIKLRDLDYSIAYYQPLDIAKNYIDSIEIERQLYFEKLVSNTETLPDFREYVDALITYNYAFKKIVIGERQEEQPAGYYDFLEQVAIEKYEFLSIPRYRQFLFQYLFKEANAKLDQKDSGGRPSADALVDAGLEAVENLKDERVRAYARFNLINIHLQEYGVEGFEKFYDYFRKHNTDPHYAAELKKVYEKKQLVAPGKPAPSFTVNDVDGKQVSLEDYKGKYVLIDFWQTLCSRSARELPYLLELYDDYQDENIAFVSISVDKDENKWREYVKEKKNIGTSLRVQHSWDSEVYQNFQVQGLPSFILIDTEGNIIDPVAPKPSSEEIREKLDKVLHK